MLNRVIGFSHLELPLFEIERPIIVELRSNGMKFIRKTSSASCTLAHPPLLIAAGIQALQIQC